MGVITKKIKGTEDVLPKQSYRWQFIENIMREEAANFGFKEMRTPVFEHTELFARGVGATTDVVQKDMYTFDTKGGESVTLRPEGTAGAARAVLEHALTNEGLPIKAYYLTSCYRYEKPQAGRLREFHQFGIEESVLPLLWQTRRLFHSRTRFSSVCKSTIYIWKLTPSVVPIADQNIIRR